MTSSMLYHCALSSLYDADDPRRFKMGTPKEVWSTIERCWEVEPTSERIIEDIMALRQVLEKIVAADGCVVSDLFLRNGRRHRRADDKGDCDRKPCRKQRIATNIGRPHHDDCRDALAQLIQRRQVQGLIAEVDEQFDADIELPGDVNIVHIDDYEWPELNDMLYDVNIVD